MKKIIELLLLPFKKILFWIKLKDMDSMWYLMGGSCYELFPPSFYYTHTEEEVERITAETLERIDKLLEEMRKQEEEELERERLEKEERQKRETEEEEMPQKSRKKRWRKRKEEERK